MSKQSNMRSLPPPWSSPARLTAHVLSGADAHLLTFTIEGVAPPVLLLPGQHIMLGLGEESRPYTPIDVASRSLTILVKAQEPALDAPKRGAFGRWVASLPIGHRVQLSGPFGVIALQQGAGGCALHLRDSGVALPVRRLALVAGGSGVTPVAQVLYAACARAEHDENQSLELSVLISDKTPEKALLRDELAALRARHPRLILSLHRTFTALRSDAAANEGECDERRIDSEMLQGWLPPPSVDTVVLVSGPPQFEATVQQGLDAVGHCHSVLLSTGHVHSTAADLAHCTDTRKLDQPLLAPWLPALRCCMANAMVRRPQAPGRRDSFDELLCA